MPRTRDPVMTGTKVCIKCGAEKPVEEFYPHKSMGDGRLNKCRTCTIRENAEWRDKPANRKRWLAKRHRAKWIRDHGLTVEQYAALIEQTICPGCLRDEGELGRSLTIDHDHANGKTRGRLCQQCNLSVGNAGDDPDVLDRLAQYLRDHKE